MDSFSEDFKKGAAITAGVILTLLVLGFLFGRR
jgi:hypothetical protein